MYIKLFLLTIAVLLFSGCVAGNTHSYTVKPKLDLYFNKSVTVGVLDNRSEIVLNKETPDHVGYNRGAYGIPFTITTESKKPLAVDMTKCIVTAFSDIGITAKSAELLPGTSITDSLEILKKNSSDFLILLVLNRWQMTVYHSTIVDHDVTFTIYDKLGKVLVAREKSGELNLGANPFAAGSYASMVSPEYFAKMMESFFQNRGVIAVLEK